MRVGIDATPLASEGGGITRYARELSVALARCFPNEWFFLLSDQPFRAPENAPLNLAAAPPAKHAVERRWWSVGLPARLARLKVDVFHGLDFAVPYVPLRPSVLTLHDLSPWLPEYAPSGSERVAARTSRMLELGLATIVLTPSEAVRRQAIDFFALHPDSVVSTPLAASDCFRSAPSSAEAKPYFLFAGNLDRRKNLETLVEAWREVSTHCEVDLVIAGRRRLDTPPFPEQPGLRFAGAVSDLELASLYSNCLAFLYPSAYEGFGLPVLEAMQCGAAVIISKDPALAETAGEAAVRIDATDGKAWADAMRSAVVDANWIATWREASLRRAALFSWERTARRTREAYDEAARRF